MRTNKSIRLLFALIFLSAHPLSGRIRFHAKKNEGYFSSLQKSILEEKTSGRPMHIGWADGKVPEFQNPYTLYKHEVRLNLLGPSCYGITNKLQMSIYLGLILCPNLSFKYRFYDHDRWAMAYEIGGAIGALPVAAAGGIALPGGVLGAGTLGALTASDLFVKYFASYKPTNKLTLSARVGLSRIKAHYFGLGGFAAAGGDGMGALIFPLNSSLIKTFWMTGGIEADYVINTKNAIVFKSSIGKFHVDHVLDQSVDFSSKSWLLYPSLTWNHPWKHIHLTLGLYGFFDPPSWRLLKGNKLPMAPFANVYWILNNHVRKTK